MNDENSRYFSPIRKDSRPMLGIYHAVFVLSRVIRIFKKINELNLYQDIAFKYTRQFISHYQMGYDTIKQHAILTDVGNSILGSTRECSLIAS